MNFYTKSMADNIVNTIVRIPKILAFSFFGAYRMKITTYMNSIAAPARLIVDNKKF